MSWLLWIAAVLVLWAGIAALRSKTENRDQPPRRQGKDQAPRDQEDEIDREMLEQAEREVRDLDVTQRPEDGFEGDDWGPGAAPPGKR